MSLRMVRTGAGLALLYVLVALGTARVASRPVLPLFDGFAPPTPYGWVNPPPERAGDNVVPKPTEREFVFGPGGSPSSNASTDDAQAIVGLDEGSVAPNPPDNAVVVRIVPLDSATLGPLPAGLRAVSNAYQVLLRYAPSQAPVARLTVKGTIALTAADAADRMLYSADGQTWEELAFRPYGTDHGLYAELDAAGWFVAASSLTPGAGEVSRSGVQRGVLLTVLFVATVAGALLAVRLPSPVPAAPVRRQATSKSPKSRKSRKKPTKRRR